MDLCKCVVGKAHTREICRWENKSVKIDLGSAGDSDPGRGSHSVVRDESIKLK